MLERKGEREKGEERRWSGGEPEERKKGDPDGKGGEEKKE